MNDPPKRDVVIFTEAVRLPSHERAAYLDRACGGDAKLRQQIEALLQTQAGVGDFLEQSPQKVTPQTRLGVPAGEKPGDHIGRFKLLEQIGEGGCGIVFMAEQEEPVRRRVALKIIKPGMDSKSVIARFEAERQALALMDHPNIARVFDAGTTISGRPYFVMELVRGVKITEYCDEHMLTTAERLKLFVQVCRAVQHAHQKGIIHRDIKPSNILVATTLESDALPVVIDFGIAKATTNQRLTDKTLFTAFQMLIGTPAYMSPEQTALTSVDVDTRTDIYSLGVLLYELLTGSTPFDTGELLKAGLDEVRRVIREEEPVRPSTRLSKMTGADLTTIAQHRKSEPPMLIRAICGDLDWIVMKALEKDRTRRYETASGLALDVQRFLANEAISARPPSALYRFQKTVARNQLLFIAIGAVAVFLVASLVVVSAALARERRSRREAEAASVKSQQTTQFLEDMLQGAGPSAAVGLDTTLLSEILDQTAERVGYEMTNQPAVEAELRSLIGRTYLDIGSYNQAETMHRAALAIDRKLFTSESPKVAASLNDLGQAFWKEGKLPEAEQAHFEALTIRRQLLASNDADVATSLNNLARIYTDERKLTEAEPMIRQALAIRRSLFRGDNSEVADSLHSLCLVLDGEGKWVESEATARELLAMCRRLPKNKTVHLLPDALQDLGLAAGFNGKLDVQEASYKEAFAIQHLILKENHPYVVKSIANLGEVMRLRGNLPEAHAVLKAAISIQRKMLGEDYPDTLSSLGSLGLILEGEGQWAEAEKVHREALALRRNRAGDDDLGTLWEWGELAHVLMAQKKYGEADQLLNEVLTPAFVREPSSADLLVQRGDLMGRQGRWQEAAADAALLLEYQPAEHYRYHVLAGLLAMSDNRPAYEQLCQKILAKFANSTNAYIAERMASDCLLLTNAGVDLRLVDDLATTAVNVGTDDNAMAYFQACKALSNYRLGRFPEAVTWAEKLPKSSHPFAQAKADAVLAMADWRLGQKEPARAILAKGDALAPSILPGHDGVDLGDSWLAWLFARVSLDEATALIQSGLTTEHNSSKP
jgi:serine/threonine protein kinase/tellurite resistance protein